MPDLALLQDLRDFQEPSCVTELRSFLGILGQLNDWALDLVQHCMNMRLLLKKNVNWEFTAKMRVKFESAKKSLTDPDQKKLHPFDTNLRCIVLMDASRLH